ncbi:MAG: hypothetical protein ACD_68C00026G0001, partial [uncultured bacterium]
MTISLYNTRTRHKEILKKPASRPLSIYTCGPTVYNFAHLGNLRTYVGVDILLRFLRQQNIPLKHIINITDVGHLTSDADTGEDKIEKAARQKRKSAKAIAAYFTNAFKKDLAKLNVVFGEGDSSFVKATETLPEQIALIKYLEDKDFTYQTADGIYFNTKKYPAYSSFAKLNIGKQKSTARIRIAASKKTPTDFALWKFSPPGGKRQMEWDSPWGVGFPGWHTECAAIVLKYLGNAFISQKFNPKAYRTINIHSGGIDHIPIHHTNEIAQISGATKKLAADIWLHGEFLITAKKRMGKSADNFIKLSDLAKNKISALAYRYFLLNAHYRSPLNFSWKALAGAQKSLKNLYNKIKTLPSPSAGGNAYFDNKFYQALADDLNTPRALSVVWDLLKSNSDAAQKCCSLLKYDEILGLNLATARKIKTVKISRDLKLLLNARETARQN